MLRGPHALTHADAGANVELRSSANPVCSGSEPPSSVGGENDTFGAAATFGL